VLKNLYNSEITLWKAILIDLILLAVVTGVGEVCFLLGLRASTIFSFYTLCVLMVAIIIPKMLNNVVMCIACVFTYNYFFIEPRYTFLVYNTNYTVTFIVLFIVSMVTGSLTIRVKKAEEEKMKVKNEQIREQLLRSISHDLRTPLTSIAGNSISLLQGSDYLNEDTKKQMYSDIYDDAVYLTDLVENILAISRVNDGTVKLKLTTELLEDVVNESLHHIDRNSVKHNITTEFPDEIVLVRVDVQLLMMVITNIVNNAIKYTQDNSNIKIKVTTNESIVTMEISDDGPGIPKEDMPRIFETFYNGKKTISDHKRSMGLGLTLCKSIIESHNGTISITNNTPSGTIVRIDLPIREVENTNEQ